MGWLVTLTSPQNFLDELLDRLAGLFHLPIPHTSEAPCGYDDDSSEQGLGCVGSASPSHVFIRSTKHLVDTVQVMYGVLKKGQYS
jgi:hypothetical protein